MKNNDVINRICANAIINHALLNNDAKLIACLIGDCDSYNLSNYNETVKLISDNLKITYKRNLPISININDIPMLFVSAYEHCICKSDLYRFYSKVDADKFFYFLRSTRHPRYKKRSLNEMRELDLIPFMDKWNGSLDELISYAAENKISLNSLCKWIYYGE